MAESKHAAPWIWGEYSRRLEAELPALRPQLSQAVRERLKEQMWEVYHQKSPRPADARYGRAICAICADFPYSAGFILANKPKGLDPIFEWSSESRLPPERGTVICRGCMFRALQERDEDLALVRAVTAELEAAPRYLAMFDLVAGDRIVRTLPNATCVICQRLGPGINGIESIVCLRCHSRAHVLFRQEMDREDGRANQQKVRFEAEVEAYLAELRAIAEEEVRFTLLARETAARATAPVDAPAPAPAAAATPSPPGPRRPIDHDAEDCTAFLETEIDRAVRHQKDDRDLMGDRSKIAKVLAVLADKQPPRRDLLQQLLVQVSMLRQLMRLGITFYDYTGDELINEEMGSYRAAGSFINVGLSWSARDAEYKGPLLIVGGNREKRALAAAEMFNQIQSHHVTAYPYATHEPFQYYEVEDIYAMDEATQAEIRRRFLITPPWITMFGAWSVERFMAETPRRARVRFVTYFFMNGQEPLNLDQVTVHVSNGRTPTLPRPQR